MLMLLLQARCWRDGGLLRPLRRRRRRVCPGPGVRRDGWQVASKGAAQISGFSVLTAGGWACFLRSVLRPLSFTSGVSTYSYSISQPTERTGPYRQGRCSWRTLPPGGLKQWRWTAAQHSVALRTPRGPCALAGLPAACWSRWNSASPPPLAACQELCMVSTTLGYFWAALDLHHQHPNPMSGLQ